MKTPFLMLRIEDQQDLPREVTRKVDEFLDIYSLYLATGLTWVRDEARLKAYELRLIEPNFHFRF